MPAVHLDAPAHRSRREGQTDIDVAKYITLDVEVVQGVAVDQFRMAGGTVATARAAEATKRRTKGTVPTTTIRHGGLGASADS